MGEEKKAGEDGGNKKKDAGGAAPQPIVLKVDLHCAGCASKVRKAIRHAPGVESVTPDMAAGKVVVTGPTDAVELKERIEARAKKPVQIVSVALLCLDRSARSGSGAPAKLPYLDVAWSKVPPLGEPAPGLVRAGEEEGADRWVPPVGERERRNS